jgi:hypothetical protein
MCPIVQVVRRPNPTIAAKLVQEAHLVLMVKILVVVMVVVVVVVVVVAVMMVI